MNKSQFLKLISDGSFRKWGHWPYFPINGPKPKGNPPAALSVETQGTLRGNPPCCRESGSKLKGRGEAEGSGNLPKVRGEDLGFILHLLVKGHTRMSGCWSPS
jgi:hypothetical protein